MTIIGTFRAEAAVGFVVDGGIKVAAAAINILKEKKKTKGIAFRVSLWILGQAVSIDVKQSISIVDCNHRLEILLDQKLEL